MNSEQIGHRDAIHVPYIVSVCDVSLNPGEKVSLRNPTDTSECRCVRWGGLPNIDDEDRGEPMWHGVADPFVDGVILAGTPFRLMIRKECFTRMTHTFEIDVHDRGGTTHCHQVCDVF